MDVNYNDALQGDIQGQPLGIYDETARRMEAAVSAFRSYYSSMNPQPIEPNYPAMPMLDEKPSLDEKPKEASLISPKLIGMILGLIGAVIVSASHGIPVFLNKESALDVNLFSFEGIVAISILVMVEICLVTFAFSVIENTPSSETAKKVHGITEAGQYFILLIAVLANVYYVLQINTDVAVNFKDIWGWVRILIFLLIGTSAPLIALMTGDILAIDVLRHRANTRRDLQAWQEKVSSDLSAWELRRDTTIRNWENKVNAMRQDYENQKAQWNANLNAAWQASKAKWGGTVNIQVSKLEPLSLPSKTVPDSLRQSDRSKTLNMKGALQHIQERELELATILKTVLDRNPNATQQERAEVLAEAISGDTRGYKTVIRAYKTLGKSL